MWVSVCCLIPQSAIFQPYDCGPCNPVINIIINDPRRLGTLTTYQHACWLVPILSRNPHRFAIQPPLTSCNILGDGGYILPRDRTGKLCTCTDPVLRGRIGVKPLVEQRWPRTHTCDYVGVYTTWGTISWWSYYNRIIAMKITSTLCFYRGSKYVLL